LARCTLARVSDFLDAAAQPRRAVRDGTEKWYIVALSGSSNRYLKVWEISIRRRLWNTAMDLENALRM
jgi:hypothetical protein